MAKFENIRYQHPQKCLLTLTDNGYVIYVPGSVGVVLDDAMAQLWRAANGRSLAEIQPLTTITPALLPTALAALQKAELLLPSLDKPSEDFVPSVVQNLLVSVVIVTRDGRHHLQECLPSIVAQTYPNIEIIVVDDASSDRTEPYLQAYYPQVRILQQQDGPNFAAGCNLGVAAAKGELIFFLNNDTILDPHCISELVAAQLDCENVGGVAAMLRFYDNRPFINGLGTLVRRLGFGYDIGIGSLDVGQYAQVAEVPFLCFGAALIPRAALEQVGEVEESYQFYYEDVDWSYRARARGLKLIPAPRALVYHKFGASTGLLAQVFKTRLATRNRLWFVLKNFPLRELLLQFALYGLADGVHLVKHLWQRDYALATAVANAWLQFMAGVPGILITRKKTWSRVTREPVKLSALARPFPLPEMLSTLPKLTLNLVENQYRPYLETVTSHTANKRLLIISPDAVNSSMGGVGIRYWELAHQLAVETAVTLAIPHKTDLASTEVILCQYREGDADSLRTLVAESDIILLSGFTVFHHPFLRQVPQYIIVDLYDPMILENLERFASRPLPEREGLHNVGVATFNDLFALGDFFICASEKQRDYWLGALSAANRVNPDTYQTDPTLRQLLATVPFGLPSQPPQPSKAVLKGVRPGISPNDKLILWGGGLWDWLDPLTLVEAMPLVLKEIPTARLFFLGIKHPNPDVPPSQMAQQTLARAETLGLLETAVFYNQWTPYAERIDYLAEADVGVSLHGDHIETRFAVRTRLMDYLWANLPMVVNGGDVLGELVAKHGLGFVVPVGDVTAVAHSIIQLLKNPVSPDQFETVTVQFTWPQVAEPLKQYVAAPWRNGGNRDRLAETAVGLKLPATPLTQLPAKVITSLRTKGIGGLWQDVQAYFRWLARH